MSAKRFDWTDALNLESVLTEEEKKVRDMTRDYAQKDLMAGIINANRNEVFDRKIMSDFGRLGLLGCTLSGYVCRNHSWTY